MAKKPDITTIASGYYSTTMLNANFSELRNAFDNTLSLDGSTPNALQADLDLDNNSILNANVYANSLTLNGQLVGELSTAFNWKGAWVTATSYLQYDVVSNAGSSYIALEDHTAGATFSVDLSADKWQLLSSKGDSGAGTGDLISTNNLSDLADAPTALGNLGLTPTSAQINLLTTITSLTGSDTSLVSGTAGTTDYFAKWNADGDLVEGPSFVDEDDMASNSATAVPSQQSVKAYVDAEVGAIPGGVGVSQTWQDMLASRTAGTTYQNTTGKPIMVCIQMGSTSGRKFQVSSDGVSWVDISRSSGASFIEASAIIPNNHYYRIDGSIAVNEWAELR